MKLTREEVLENALKKIARWHGEFPSTGLTWADGSPRSYINAFGSNGERDYMRQVALDALSAATTPCQSADAVASHECGSVPDKRAELYRAAIGDRHDITADQIVIYCDPNKPGNALLQLADRLEAAVSGMQPPNNQPNLICKSCGVDRSKEDCKGDRLRCGLAGIAYSDHLAVTSAEPESRVIPCPCCGAHPRLMDLAGWEIHCKCGISMCLLGPEKEPLIAAWNRRTPVELSAQTAEPVAWMLEFDSDDENAVTVDPKVVEMWRTQHDNPYDVTPLYTHPAKTEQPSLSDERIDEIAYSITTPGLVTWWRLFAREIERISAQRQDSDKDAERYRFIRDQFSPVSILIDGIDEGLALESMDAEIDRAIANGAPK